MSPKGQAEQMASPPVLLGRPGLQAIVRSPVVFRKSELNQLTTENVEFSEGGPACYKAPQAILPTKGILKVIKVKNRMASCTKGQFIEDRSAYGPNTGMVAYSRGEENFWLSVMGCQRRETQTASAQSRQLPWVRLWLDRAVCSELPGICA